MNLDITQHIPVQTYSRPSAISNAYLSKSAVLVNINDHKEMIFGFSFSQNKSEVEFISKMEVLERLFAYYPFLRELNADQEEYLCTLWRCQQGGDQKSYAANQVVFGLEAPLFSLDASGLAAHQSIIDAEIHAVYELIERHFLAKIWYGDGSLAKINFADHSLDLPNYRIKYYTMNFEWNIPFVIAIIENSLGNLFVCGSKLASCFYLAARKARDEACMMLDALLQGDDGYCYSTETKSRIFSAQNAGLTQQRANFFKHKIVRTLLFTKQESDQNLQDNILLFLHEYQIKIFIACIYSSEHLTVVRALSDDLMKIRNERVHSTLMVPMDPFC